MKSVCGAVLFLMSFTQTLWADSFSSHEEGYKSYYQNNIILYGGAIPPSVDEEDTLLNGAHGVVSAVFTPGFGTQNQLMGEGNHFSSEIKTVFFNTELDGMVGKEVKHCWYYKGIMVSEETFVVDSDRFYATSRKNMLPNSIGEWRVEVRQKNTLLKEKTFSYLARI